MSIAILRKGCEIKTKNNKASLIDNHGVFCDTLGVKYYAGIEVLKDYKKAFKLFKKSADKKNPYGQLNIGYMYTKGKDVDVVKNLCKAKLYINKAFYNPETNSSIRLLARKVWHQYELWKYNNPKINTKCSSINK